MFVVPFFIIKFMVPALFIYVSHFQVFACAADVMRSGEVIHNYTIDRTGEGLETAGLRDTLEKYRK